MKTKRYSDVKPTKASGATFTPVELAQFVATRIVDRLEKAPKDKELHVFDPSLGDGALLSAIITSLKENGFTQLKVKGCEVNESHIQTATDRLKSRHDIDLEIVSNDFLEYVTPLFTGPTLLQTDNTEKFDIIIANPPYVRTQILGAQKAQEIAKTFHLKGRVDLYFPFILGIAKLLKRNGIAGVITSNRYMSIKAGAPVRRSLIEEFTLLSVFDLGDTKVFDAAILPAVFFATAKTATQESKVEFTQIYESSAAPEMKASSVFDTLGVAGIYSIAGKKYEVKKGDLNLAKDHDKPWRLSNSKNDTWLQAVAKNTWKTFAQLGKIRVGVKTTADKIFIRDDWTEATNGNEPETLLPLITHHIAKRYRSDIPEKKILYTHELVNGKRKAIDIAKFPNTSKYLYENREALESRQYVINAGRNWFEIWVPQAPDAWEQPKLIMRDISEKPCFWVDLNHSVVNGDCYWMIPDKKYECHIWLALGVSNSSFIEKFYDHKFNNKLYSGKRRYITQYVNEFPLPDPNRHESKEIANIAMQLHSGSIEQDQSEIEKKLDELVFKAFEVS